jgi:hypothetical protein
MTKLILLLLAASSAGLQAQAPPPLKATQTASTSSRSDAPYHVVVKVQSGVVEAAKFTVSCDKQVMAATTPATSGRVYILGRQPTSFAFEPKAGVTYGSVSFDVWAAQAISCRKVARF